MGAQPIEDFLGNDPPFYTDDQYLDPPSPRSPLFTPPRPTTFTEDVQEVYKRNCTGPYILGMDLDPWGYDSHWNLPDFKKVGDWLWSWVDEPKQV